MATDKIKVAVRVRPFNRREMELGTQCVVEMEGQQTILQYPQSAHEKIERATSRLIAAVRSESLAIYVLTACAYVIAPSTLLQFCTTDNDLYL